MFRIAVILLIVCLLFRWAFGEWPWAMLGGKPSKQEALRKARSLLGVSRSASEEEIVAAHRRLLSSVHPDKGGSDGEVHSANDARDLLLDNIRRKAADKE